MTDTDGGFIGDGGSTGVKPDNGDIEGYGG